jgi:hypothetical protein
VGNDNYTGDIMDCAYFTITTVISGINSNTPSKTDEDTSGRGVAVLKYTISLLEDPDNLIAIDNSKLEKPRKTLRRMLRNGFAESPQDGCDFV